MKKLIRKKLPLICACLAVFALVGISAVRLTTRGGAAAVSAEITNWGLSFGEDGTTPRGNASSEYLKDFNSYYTIENGKKQIYLTFDAGFENGNTEKILDALKKHGVKATFFLVGNYFETEPELVKRMVQEGHLVGNHTYSHPDMSKISELSAFCEELVKNEELYKSITGEDMPKLYRPPQGKFCEQNLKMANDLGYNTVFWSLAYVDWYQDQQPTKEEAFSKLLPRIHPGAVVLLHSTSSTNADILDELLTEWEQMGYSFGSLEELLNN